MTDSYGGPPDYGTGQSNPLESNEDVDKECPFCGRIVQDGTPTCPVCGTSMSAPVTAPFTDTWSPVETSYGQQPTAVANAISPAEPGRPLKSWPARDEEQEMDAHDRARLSWDSRRILAIAALFAVIGVLGFVGYRTMGADSAASPSTPSPVSDGFRSASTEPGAEFVPVASELILDVNDLGQDWVERANESNRVYQAIADCRAQPMAGSLSTASSQTFSNQLRRFEAHVEIGVFDELLPPTTAADALAGMNECIFGKAYEGALSDEKTEPVADARTVSLTEVGVTGAVSAAARIEVTGESGQVYAALVDVVVMSANNMLLTIYSSPGDLQEGYRLDLQTFVYTAGEEAVGRFQELARLAAEPGGPSAPTRFDIEAIIVAPGDTGFFDEPSDQHRGKVEALEECHSSLLEQAVESSSGEPLAHPWDGGSVRQHVIAFDNDSQASAALAGAGSYARCFIESLKAESPPGEDSPDQEITTSMFDQPEGPTGAYHFSSHGAGEGGDLIKEEFDVLYLQVGPLVSILFANRLAEVAEGQNVQLVGLTSEIIDRMTAVAGSAGGETIPGDSGDSPPVAPEPEFEGEDPRNSQPTPDAALSDQELAESYLLSLDDLPSGWAESTEDEDDELFPDDPEYAACAQLFADFEALPTNGAAIREFSSGEFISLQSSVDILASSEHATRGMDMINPVFACMAEASLTIKGPQGDVIETSFEPISFANFGDRTDAYRFFMKMRLTQADGAIQEINWYYDFAIIQHGRTVITVGASLVGIPFPTVALEEFARIASDKVEPEPSTTVSGLRIDALRPL